MIKWFIGYDKNESVTAYVLAHSLQRQSSLPVSITFLNRDSLRGIFTRERGQYDSTDFSISRFLVPYLCNYSGYAIFSDCDMIVKDDPAKLWAWRDESFAVRVVKHNHHPNEKTKFLSQIQTDYNRKNWSSVMLFNNSKCKALTTDYVNNANGLELHEFKWLKDEEIGDLPKQWNLLVDYDKHDPHACLVHYTKGGPYFREYANCDYHQDWWTEKALMTHILDRDG
jgi:lipopolysaccharide biosynthesis glycosyltransferase